VLEPRDPDAQCIGADTHLRRKGLSAFYFDAPVSCKESRKQFALIGRKDFQTGITAGKHRFFTPIRVAGYQGLCVLLDSELASFEALQVNILCHAPDIRGEVADFSTLLDVSADTIQRLVGGLVR